MLQKVWKSRPGKKIHHVYTDEREAGEAILVSEK